MPRLPSHIARMSKDFHDIRRQSFMYREAYESILDLVDEFESNTIAWTSVAPEKKRLDLGYVAAMNGLFGDVMDRISLEYTAGAPMEELKGLYPEAVDAFEAWCFSFRDWHYHEFPESRAAFEALHQIPCQVKPADRGSYLELLRLLSLGVLFGEGQQLRRIASLISMLRKEDTIIEELLLPFVVDRAEVEEMYHFNLYDDLTGAAWEKSPAESARCMTKFLKSWYKFFKGAPWHNAHMEFGKLEGSPDWSNYYGYWAWEAAAIAYLYELDDSSYRDHMVYPKDLVAWARKQGPVPKTYTPPASEAPPVLSAQPGQVCPRTGTWMTTAMLERRSIQMREGERMPKEERDRSGNWVIWFFKGE